jgi:hypothetical protein
MERNNVIEILDAGNEGPSFMGPELFCCGFGFSFYRSYP